MVLTLGRQRAFLLLVTAIFAIASFLFSVTYTIKHNLSLVKRFASLTKWSDEDNDNDDLENMAIGALLLNTTGCQVPNFDPFDPTTRDQTKLLPEQSCPEAGGLTYLDDGGFVRINKTVSRVFYTDVIAYCECQEIVRPSSKLYEDFQFQYTDAVRFNERVKFESEFVRVACFGANKTRLYVGFHAQVRQKITNIEKQRSFKNSLASTKKEVNQPNVILIGFDSTSRLNSIRQLKTTRKYLFESLRAVELKAYNRVGMNTFPNMIPLLTGQYVNDFGADRFRSHIDDLPLIWKRYSRRGYRTLFAEDGHPIMGFFTYRKPGFNQTPTDYYLRPLNLAMKSEYNVRYNEPLCIGAMPENRFVLNWLYDVIATPDPRPLFAVAFFWRRIHEDMNELSRLDRMFAAFFRRLADERRLENTVLVVFSDHGVRFGQQKRTPIGVAEVNLPMSLIRVPPTFCAKNPSRLKNLKRNAGARLTTPFDVHETLVHILNLCKDHEDDDERGNSRYRPEPGKRRLGVSLFEQISSRRSCENLDIAAPYCGCRVNQVNTTSAQRDVVL